ncbi:hypothetical protein GCM10025862_02520 [Arsenicicoccus piscis]|uniref:Thiamine pyrophosphate enzyme TPP-binding domain-containing protein n=1 Tax=Arsenicicoccus piscis TaxID=673954 RepID=A0ABQ6HI02_9MICO|nr:hypothetical protein GCM10025862_02520 [Arsenicicoccus piscis]
MSRAVARLLAAVDRVEVVTETPQWADPGKRASRVWGLAALRALETTDRSAPDRAWTERWRNAGRVLDDAVRSNADHESPHQTTGLAVATTLLEHPAVTHLFVGSSNAIRDVDLAMSPRSHAEVIASRGLAGIDGCVSTAVGLALAVGRPLHALVGDLTFLHDANGLLIGPGEPVPDLTIVVVNDDGGGIFSTLEYGEPSRATQFERVFGTPTGTSIGQVCAAHGVRHEVAATAADLEGPWRSRRTVYEWWRCRWIGPGIVRCGTSSSTSRPAPCSDWTCSEWISETPRTPTSLASAPAWRPTR